MCKHTNTTSYVENTELVTVCLDCGNVQVESAQEPEFHIPEDAEYQN